MPEQGQTIDLRHRNPCRCRDCHRRKDCLPANLEGSAIIDLEDTAGPGRTLHTGDCLYRQSDTLTAVYAVRSGSFKGVRCFPGGHEQVCAFYMPGELIGLDGLYGGQYQCRVQALDTAHVCAFEPGSLERLARRHPRLQHQLLRLASRELSLFMDRDFEQPAEGRVASFLLHVSERMAQLGCSAHRYRLSMSRRDIANYLGLAPETISRVLRKMVAQSLVEVERREVELIDRPALERLAAGS
ncbi:helix-turn-helix domain-containing protein [Natronospira sp.]|uniref:helix-turn-helix domain-containing protein n=1 Tax=Natronospira sp. TaxID=2024970 RepID=UPI0038734491